MGSELKELRRLCEYESNCCSPADLTVAGCTRIELWCQRLRVECRSEFAVTFGATSCECDGYILAVTKNAVTNSAVMLAVWLVGGFRISPAASKL